VLQQGSKLMVYAWYQVNKEYISTVLCINKDIPDAHCEGHCVLTKKLQQAESQESKNLPALLKQKIELNYIQASFQAIVNSLSPRLLLNISFGFADHLMVALFLDEIFDPPKVSFFYNTHFLLSFTQ
jgi:hypothetical protein